MNPLTNMKNVKKLSEQELSFGMKTSWHDQYRHSAWVFVGGLPYDLTEGDIICVFSQYGEVVNINLVRDKGTGKSRGFCFICYEDQRSTNLAVDNFNGIKILNRTIRVDHCEGYKAPKDDKMDEESRALHAEGCAPGSKFGDMPKLASSNSNGGLDKSFNLPPMESLLKIKTEKDDLSEKPKDKKEKKVKKTKEKIKKLFRKKKKEESSSSSSSSESSSESDDEKSRKKKAKSKRKKEQSSSSSSEESDSDSSAKKKKKTKKDKSKRRKDDSSSSSEESESDSKKRKTIKKSRKDSSSDGESNSDSEEPQKRTEMTKQGPIKNKPSESEERRDESKIKNKESSQRFCKSSREEADSSPVSRRDKYSERYRSEVPEKSSKDTKNPGDDARDNFRGYGNERKYKEDGRHNRDRRDDGHRRVDRDRRDDRERKYYSDKNYEDRRKYDHERKEKDRR